MIFAAIPRTLMMALTMTIPADELGNVWMLFACFNKVKGCHKKKNRTLFYIYESGGVEKDWILQETSQITFICKNSVF